MGYGVVEETGDALSPVAWGVLTAAPHLPLPQRLHTLSRQLHDIIVRHRPTEVAVEEPFTARNPRSALAVGQALALALLAAADHGLPVHTYPPALVKQTVTNYGRSTKEQVREMVRIHLGTPGEIEEHAADALAIALCRLHEGRLEARLAVSPPQGVAP